MHVWRSPTPSLSAPPLNSASCWPPSFQGNSFCLSAGSPTPHTSQRECSPVPIRRHHSLAQTLPWLPSALKIKPQLFLRSPWTSTLRVRLPGQIYLPLFFQSFLLLPLFFLLRPMDAPVHACKTTYIFLPLIKFLSPGSFCTRDPFVLESPPTHTHCKPRPCDAQSQTPHPGGQSCPTLCQKGGGWALPHFSSLTSSSLFAG